MKFLPRFSKRNMILAGMWFSKEKPTMSSFLEPLMNEVNDLSRTGNMSVIISWF